MIKIELSLLETELLLDRWRFKPQTLSTKDRDLVWGVLDNIVRSKIRRHYKRNQKGFTQNKRFSDSPWGETAYITQTDRILLLADFLLTRKHKSIGWCVTAYKRRFQNYEEYLRLKTNGLGLSQQIKNKDGILVERDVHSIVHSKLIGDSIKIRAVLRDNPEATLEELADKLREKLHHVNKTQKDMLQRGLFFEALTYTRKLEE
jgi:hypothetical protein